MSNQCAAVDAVRRSILASSTGGVRCQPRSSAVEISKRMGEDEAVVPPRARALFIMPSDGSRPVT